MQHSPGKENDTGDESATANPTADASPSTDSRRSGKIRERRRMQLIQMRIIAVIGSIGLIYKVYNSSGFGVACVIAMVWIPLMILADIYLRRINF
jgi:hypothetical protein